MIRVYTLSVLTELNTKNRPTKFAGLVSTFKSDAPSIHTQRRIIKLFLLDARVQTKRVTCATNNRNGELSLRANEIESDRQPFL